MTGQNVTPSRLTFRDAVDGVCWQKQLRDKYLDEGTPPVPHLDLKRAVIRPVSRKTAEQIILKYEWLGTMGSNVNRFYGVFFGNYCAGVTVWQGGGLPSLVKSFRLRNRDLAYLARGACVHWAPPGTNSKLVAWSLKMEAKRGAKLAIAFSDTDAAEIGTIYQACNWIYIGVGSSWEQWISPRGKIVTKNTMTGYAAARGVRSCDFEDYALTMGWKMQSTNPKHRYVYILDKTDKALIDRIERMRQPYPKRAGVVQTVEQPGPPEDGVARRPARSNTITL